MALSDNKKAQTVRNLWYLRVAKSIQESQGVVAAIRAAIAGNNLLSQFTQAERDAMQAVETNLNTLAALPGVTAAAGKYMPRCGDRGVKITGVN